MTMKENQQGMPRVQELLISNKYRLQVEYLHNRIAVTFLVLAQLVHKRFVFLIYKPCLEDYFIFHLVQFNSSNFLF